MPIPQYASRMGELPVLPSDARRAIDGRVQQNPARGGVQHGINPVETKRPPGVGGQIEPGKKALKTASQYVHLHQPLRCIRSAR